MMNEKDDIKKVKKQFWLAIGIFMVIVSLVVIGYASALLGFMAWILPVINIMLIRRKKSWNWGTLAVLSLGSCATSIWLLNYYTYHKVNIEDWAAVLDTTQAIMQVTAVLLIGTLILNLVTYIVTRKNLMK